MTVFEALKQTVDENGNIVIPIGATRGENELPGTVSEEWLKLAFGSQLDQQMPLSEGDYEALKNTVRGQWEVNWQWYKDNSVISVQ